MMDHKSSRSYLPSEKILLYIFMGIFFFFFITTVILHEQTDHWKRQYDILQYQTSQKPAEIVPIENNNPYFYHVFEHTTPSGNYKIRLEYNLGLTSASPCEARARIYRADGTGPLSYNDNDGWRGEYTFTCPAFGYGMATWLTNPTFGLAERTDEFFLHSTDTKEILYNFRDADTWRIRSFNIDGIIATTSADLSSFLTEEQLFRNNTYTTKALHLYDNQGKEYESLPLNAAFSASFTRIEGLNAAIALVPIKESTEVSNSITIRTVQIYLIDFQKKEFSLFGESTQTLRPMCPQFTAVYTSGQIEVQGECLDSIASFPY